MRFYKETELNNYIKDHDVSGLYLLYGQEDYLVGRWKDRLVKGFADDSFNFLSLDGQSPDLNEIYDATQQLPLMAPSKCVLVENLDSKKMLKAEQDRLKEIFEELPAETVLVITSKNLDPKSAIGKKLIALADHSGVAAELSPRDTAGITRHLVSVANKRGCKLSPQLAKELIRLCGNQLLTLTNELEKACSYAGEGEITLKHISGVVTPLTEEKVFDLGRAILDTNPQRAMEIVSNLIYLRESPVMVISTLTLSYSDLYRARVAKNSGKSYNDVVGMFNYRGREFRVRSAFNSNAAIETLRDSLDVLYKYDRMMKSTGIDSNLLLEQAVMELVYIRGR